MIDVFIWALFGAYTLYFVLSVVVIFTLAKAFHHLYETHEQLKERIKRVYNSREEKGE